MNADHHWNFHGDEHLNKLSISVRGSLNLISSHRNSDDPRPIIAFGRADPSAYPSFHTSPLIVESLVNAVQSFKFNSYPSTHGLLPARRLFNYSSSLLCLLILISFPFCWIFIIVFNHSKSLHRCTLKWLRRGIS